MPKPKIQVLITDQDSTVARIVNDADPRWKPYSMIEIIVAASLCTDGPPAFNPCVCCYSRAPLSTINGVPC